MNTLIYVTEDDANIRELLRCTLESFSYKVCCFESAEELLEACRKTLPALFLLDIMLPGLDGIAALHTLRAQPETRGIPVIMLTAKASEADKVTGLDSGADDYITKPFGVLELTARVRAALRRKEEKDGENGSHLAHKELTMDLDKRLVTLAGQPVELTLKEFELLRLLLEQATRVLTREELLNTIWGYDYIGESRTLDMHIKTLRQKLGDDADAPNYIKTVRGIGYTLA